MYWSCDLAEKLLKTSVRAAEPEVRSWVSVENGAGRKELQARL